MSLIGPLIGAVISLSGLLFDLTMTSIKNLLVHSHLNKTIIALNPKFNVSVSKPSTLFRTARNMATLTVYHLLLDFPVYQSFHLLKRRTSTVTNSDLKYCAR